MGAGASTTAAGTGSLGLGAGAAAVAAVQQAAVLVQARVSCSLQALAAAPAAGAGTAPKGGGAGSSSSSNRYYPDLPGSSSDGSDGGGGSSGAPAWVTYDASIEEASLFVVQNLGGHAGAAARAHGSAVLCMALGLDSPLLATAAWGAATRARVMMHMSNGHWHWQCTPMAPCSSSTHGSLH